MDQFVRHCAFQGQIFQIFKDSFQSTTGLDKKKKFFTLKWLYLFIDFPHALQTNTRIYLEHPINIGYNEFFRIETL